MKWPGAQIALRATFFLTAYDSRRTSRLSLNFQRDHPAHTRWWLGEHLLHIGHECLADRVIGHPSLILRRGPDRHADEGARLVWRPRQRPVLETARLATQQV